MRSCASVASVRDDLSQMRTTGTRGAGQPDAIINLSARERALRYFSALIYGRSRDRVPVNEYAVVNGECLGHQV
jgi:hypothetical protein